MWQTYYFIPNVAVEALLKFLIGFLGIFIKDIDQKIPKSLYLLWKQLDVSDDKFTRYTVCSKCHHCYSFEEAIKLKVCSHVEFPNHRNQKYRQPCGTKLVNEVLFYFIFFLKHFVFFFFEKKKKKKKNTASS